MPPTRESLLAAASQLLDSRGAQALTLRAVASRAGLSHNAPYKHFADKHDLLASLAASHLRELTERITTAAAHQSDPLAQVEAAALAYLDWAQAHPARFQLAFGPWPVPHDELGQAAETATAALYNCVHAAHRQGVLRIDPDRAAAMVWTLAHGANDLDLAGHLQKKPDSPTAADLVRDLIAVIGHG